MGGAATRKPIGEARRRPAVGGRLPVDSALQASAPDMPSPASHAVTSAKLEPHARLALALSVLPMLACAPVPASCELNLYVCEPALQLRLAPLDGADSFEVGTWTIQATIDGEEHELTCDFDSETACELSGEHLAVVLERQSVSVFASHRDSDPECGRAYLPGSFAVRLTDPGGVTHVGDWAFMPEFDHEEDRHCELELLELGLDDLDPT